VRLDFLGREIEGALHYPKGFLLAQQTHRHKVADLDDEALDLLPQHDLRVAHGAAEENNLFLLETAPTNVSVLRGRGCQLPNRIGHAIRRRIASYKTTK